jgi:Chlorophyll A-B binding protein
MLLALQLLLGLSALRSVASFTSSSRSPETATPHQKRRRATVVEALVDAKANSSRSTDRSVGSSIAIPFLPFPPVLSECSLAGNVGFDPLGLAKSQVDLLMYREIEVKHGRLAMLVRKQAAVHEAIGCVSDKPFYLSFSTGGSRMAYVRDTGSSNCG